MFALIFENKVVEISEKKFPVIESMKWVECDDKVKAGWFYVENVFKESLLPDSERLIQLKENLIVSIKSQAARKIVSVYPEWQQRNYMAAISEIHNKEIVAIKATPFVGQYQLTAEEKQTIKNADACKKFITEIRAKSNTLERSLDDMTIEQLAAFDPTRDSHWQ